MNDDDIDDVLDDGDLEELDQLLASLQNADAMRLDVAHGLLTAIAVGPDPVPAEEWLPLVLGQTPTVDSEEAAERLVALLLGLSRAIATGLERFSFDPVFAQQNDDGSLDVGGWCEGFSMGVDLRAQRWGARMQDDAELMALLAPIVELGVDDGVFAELKDTGQPALSESERDDRLQRLPSLLIDLMHYWRGEQGGLRATGTVH